MEKKLWRFTYEELGEFVSKDTLSQLKKAYFPLFNFQNMMSCTTPELKGDIKTSQHTFLTIPLVTEDIPHTLNSRNIWIKGKNFIWSATGCSYDSYRYEKEHSEKAEIKAGILYFTLKRENKKLGISAETTLFVPPDSTTEIIISTIKNISKKTIEITPYFAIPLYGRSADNLRDHRQVTTLLNRLQSHKHGVILKPTMKFDERGHRINSTLYGVLGFNEDGTPPSDKEMLMENYIHNGTTLYNPHWVYNDEKILSPHRDGKEAVGALKFKKTTLKPNETKTIIIHLIIADNNNAINKTIKKYNTKEKVLKTLQKTKTLWKQHLDRIQFNTGNNDFNNWIRWVGLQPFARKIYGCSFLPDFGYGRGGRGWRDLWQDLLSIILTSPNDARNILINNYAGIRTDGSNATIIGAKQGEFIADRNNISRTFMDHGVWPLKTTSLYIEQTGDIKILLEKVKYFRDHQIFRGKKINHQWDIQKDGNWLKTKTNKTYKGTILEHIIVEHITSSLNVGKQNICKLENADWNDGLDMAPIKGQSVPFTSFYADNLSQLARYCEILEQKGYKEIELFEELYELIIKCRNYPNLSPAEKNQILNKYMEKTYYYISGNKKKIKTGKLIEILKKISKTMHDTINKQEWVQLNKNTGFYNGYYDNDGRKVDGIKNKKINMCLTGQVFPILCNTASDEKIPMIFNAVKKYLQHKKLKGIHLNTNFKELKMNLGRAYGFAYGTKENGAFFSHMNVMFANSLFSRGYAEYGTEIIKILFKMSIDSEKSKIFPGLPEYFDLDGKGAYHYLTGSASWMIYTLLTQVFGIKGKMGNLEISPKLTNFFFDSANEIQTTCYFAEKKFRILYTLKQKKQKSYQIAFAECKTLPLNIEANKILIKKHHISKSKTKEHMIKIHLN